MIGASSIKQFLKSLNQRPVSWPYCERRCTYCNFNKYISKTVDEQRMEKCLLEETETLIKLSGVHTITSVFFGGGTPSLAPPSTVHRLLDTVARHARVPQGSEVTLEVNPTVAARQKLKDFRAAGINRVSIGVQSLDIRDLRLLGRDHTSEDAIRCVEAGHKLFPWRSSVNLIFGRHLQTLQSWACELRQVLPLLQGHISLYQLTLERGTKLFKQVAAGEHSVPDSDIMADMYTAAVELLQSHGLRRYEVSNFAAEGCESSHNQNYWQGGQYIGVGPGAHGRFAPKGIGDERRQARVQTLEPDNWMYEVEVKGHATRRAVPLDLQQRLEEFLMTALRTRDGISHQRWQSVVSADFPSLQQVCCGLPAARSLLEAGLLSLTSCGLRASDKGILVLDSVLPHLMESLQCVLATGPKNHECITTDRPWEHIGD